MTEDTINVSIRLKSLVFWLDRVGKADEVAFIRRFWDGRNYAGFRKDFPECPFCGGSPVLDPQDNGAPVTVNGIEIERVHCYCLTLERLCNKSSRWYESYYTDSSL